MFSVIKRDWLLFSQKLVFVIPAFSISLILLYGKGDEGYFVIGLPMVFMLAVMLFVIDDRIDNARMLINLPLDRRTIARGRFLSAWAMIGAGMLYVIFLGFLLGLFQRAAFSGFLSFLNLKTLFVYLWFISGIAFVTFPIFFLLLGRGLQAMMLLILGANLLLGGFFFVRAQQVGPDLFSGLKGLVLVIYNGLDSPLDFTLSLLGIVFVNAVNLRLCESIFKRKQF